MLFLLVPFGCTQSKSIDSASIDTADSIEEPQEIDADGDGYPLWSSTVDVERADCDDADPSVTPETERFIPAGKFYRGEDNTPWSGPQRAIVISDYCIDTFETTNVQFVEFMEAQLAMGLDNETVTGEPLFDFEDDDDVFPERILMTETGFDVMMGYEMHPVVEVWKWSGEAYCEWAGKALPTEAQWEKAARGTDRRNYPWGNSQPTCELANFGFIGEQCIGDTIDVGSYPAGVSPYGVHDMAGNVAEWVSDWFGMNYYEDSPDTDPTGPETGWFDDGQGNAFEAIIARSGNHATGQGDIQTHYRQPEPVDGSSNGIGFRCARALLP